MQRYLYFSLTPEALIASMLPPQEFGNYQAVGSKKRTRGQSMFFEVDVDLVGPHFSMKTMEEKCVPDANGELKKSVYLSIYRVLEHLPIAALKNLYLVTDDGRVLELNKSEYKTNEQVGGLHLYQELCPVVPRIASSLAPADFMKFVTDTSKPISVPKLVFVDLRLDGLADDPRNGIAEDLPYKNIAHVRDCLLQVNKDDPKQTKTVIRVFKGDLLYRTCKNGFFVGDQDTLLYYHLPTQAELQEEYYAWWRSSLTIGFS
jgi:hypothetical protein